MTSAPGSKRVRNAAPPLPCGSAGAHRFELLARRLLVPLPPPRCAVALVLDLAGVLLSPVYPRKPAVHLTQLRHADTAPEPRAQLDPGQAVQAPGADCI